MAKETTVTRAVRTFLRAIGAHRSQARAELSHTPERVATLWRQHMLWGEGRDLAKTLGRGMKARTRTPVITTELGVHLVCPHHLTVALGTADLAYWPGERVVGLGRLSALVRAATSRFVMQEHATRQICDTLLEQLEAEAAAVRVTARHPCHVIAHARSHASATVTWAFAGPKTRSGELARMIERASARRGG